MEEPSLLFRSISALVLLIAIVAGCAGAPAPTAAPTSAASVAPTVSPTPRRSPSPTPRPAPSFEIKSSTLTDGVTVSDVTFDGGRPTDAYFVSPATAARGSSAGIVWFHWYETSSPKSNRTEFLDEAKAMAAEGVVSVLVDGTFPWHDAPTSATHDVAAVNAELTMLSAARDLLLAQPAVDPKRVALVGHDFGAMYSSVLFGRDQSIAALVAMTPTATWADWFLRYWPISDNPTEYKSAMAPLDPITALANTNARPTLFQFGNQDRFISAATAAEIVTAAGSGAERKDYEAGHELNDAALSDRDAWLADVLDLTN